MEIPLHQAPEEFFDQKQWDEFIECFESRAVALARIGCPPSLTTGYYRQDDPGLSKSVDTQERQTEELFQLGNALIGEFKNKLIKKQIIATGVPFNSDDRVPIPPEQCGLIWPIFVEDKFMGPMFEFTDVRLLRNNDRRTRAAEILERCTNFLRQRSAHGESRRKILEKEALERFGDNLTTRVFTKAYTAVFNKRRGRPRTKK